MNKRTKEQKKKERERKVYTKVLRKREVLRVSKREDNKQDLIDRKSRKRVPIRNDSLTPEEAKILQENLEILTEAELNYFKEKEENHLKIKKVEGVDDEV